ncbi:FkbM family methyltransferase [Bradyrhizobium sp. USDA 4353]
MFSNKATGEAMNEIATLKEEVKNMSQEIRAARSLLEELRMLTKLQLLGPERVLEFQYEGVPIKLSVPKPYSDGIQNFIFTSETFYEIKELVDFRQRFVKSQMTFLDVGAHIGNHSVFFAKCCAAASVHAFEPNTATFELLTRNFRLNGMSVANLHNCGIGKECKHGMRMSENPFGTHFGTAINIGSDTSAGGGLIIDKLDSFGFENCDVIKIDVEGWEIDALSGAEQTIRKFRPILWIEIERPNLEQVTGILGPHWLRISRAAGRGNYTSASHCEFHLRAERAAVAAHSRHEEHGECPGHCGAARRARGLQ